MNKGKSNGSGATPITDASKAGDLFTAQSLNEYAEISRDGVDERGREGLPEVVGWVKFRIFPFLFGSDAPFCSL